MTTRKSVPVSIDGDLYTQVKSHCAITSSQITKVVNGAIETFLATRGRAEVEDIIERSHPQYRNDEEPITFGRIEEVRPEPATAFMN
jgi:hypothetical protein